MEKIGRKALFQDAPSHAGNDPGNGILEDWIKILKSAVEGDGSAKIDTHSVDGSLKSLGEALNLAIEKISTDSADIVNQKRQIGNAQKRYQEIVQQNPMPMLLVNKEFKVVVTNPAYEEMSGYTRNELRKMNLRDFRVEGKAGDGIKKALSAGVRSTGEVVVNLPSGKRILEQHCIPVRNDADEITNVLLAYNDLTDLRREMAEAQLLAKKAEAFIKQNPQAITVLGPDKSRIDLNKEYERVWRGGYEELMRKKLYDFDITMTGGEDFYASYETKQLAISEMTLNWPNGEKTYVTLYQVPILDDKGDILVNYYIYQDRTKDVSVEKYLNNEVEKLKGNLEMFARGDLRFNASVDKGNEYTTVVRDNFAQINGSIEGVRDAVSAVLMDVGTLAEAAVEGKLDTRVDASAHNGEFAKVIEGVNETLNAVVAPLTVAADFLDGIAGGAQLDLVTGEYPGDYARIKDSANTCHTVLNALVNEVIELTQAGVAGNLDVRGNPENFDGAWSTIVGGVNNTLDAVVGPLNVAAEYVDRISKGDIPEKVTDDMKGDFNEIKNNLNQCIDAVNLLVADAAMLASAAAMEEFNTRADAAKHNGDFRKVVEGMNQTFDGVAGKLYLYESSIDAIPFPVSVTDMDMNWIFFNKAVADMTGLRREDMLGKQCSHWNADICNTKRCGVQMLRKGELTSFFKQPGMDMDLRVDTQYIQNAKGEKIGHIEIIQDITAANRVTEFQKQEVGRLTANLAEIARGNTNIDTTVAEADKYTAEVRENFVQIKGALDETIAAVGLLVNDAGMLADAAVEGKLDTRADASKHHGDFRKVVDGVNGTLDAVIGPLNVAAEYVDRISKGDIPEKVTEAWKGDFNEVKNNLNQCIDAVNLLVGDAGMLAQAGIDGRLDARADASKHHGDFRKVVDGVNGTLDAIGAPLQETMDVLERMAVNDYTRRIENNYPGDYAKLTGNLNQVLDVLNTVLTVVEAISGGDMRYLETYKTVGRRCENDRLVPSFVVLMENLQAVVDDAEMLAEAGVNGHLDVRADATRHAGAYGEVISGINNMLDAVVGPLNVTAEYVDRIAKGDIPERITDAYAGDFNEIKNNLNGCIDAVNLLVKDTNLLADAAAAGKLTTRADISKHSGDYAKIVGGVNQTLDLIIGPFREVNAAIVQLGLTTDETSSGATEIAKAAGQVAVTSQQCADLSSSLIVQIEKVNRQVSDLSASNEEIASTSQEVYQHAVQTADVGEKAQKLGAEANTKMNIVEGIAKQSVDEMQNLNTRMKEINNVVSQVNDITNQINLLALNAAIEAARAGEHGRGFAVVAGEVRNLAVEAKKATAQIDQVIAGVQAISAKTAEAIGSAHTEIGSGVVSVNATIGALNDIVKGSLEMKVNMDEIAKAVEEQAVVANHIVEAMEESNRLTRENQRQVEELASLAEEASASTEEIGSSVHELKDMAGNLKQTMDRFEV
jgi:methyl-accepting chemotaxis protein